MIVWIWSAFRSKTRISAAWCSQMHDSTRWPIHGHYECGVCGHRYRVPWAASELAGAARGRPALPELSPTILPALLLVAMLVSPVSGAERTMAGDSAAAAAVLERFIAGQHQRRPWPVETIHIEASLPKWKKTGSLTAIRRVSPVGEPDYEVLESAGDATVRRQVISRYISAEERAAELPPSSVAVTPANYKFHFVGTVSRGNRLAYAYRMIPRRKRDGLLDGVIWLDSETAIAVRKSGRLSKSPSVFVKRISLTREEDLDNSEVAARITYVAVETRLAGRAQLVIFERPSRGALAARIR